MFVYIMSVVHKICIIMDIKGPQTENLLVYFDMTYSVEQLWQLLADNCVLDGFFVEYGDHITMHPDDGFANYVPLKADDIIASLKCCHFYIEVDVDSKETNLIDDLDGVSAEHTNCCMVM